MEGVRCSAFDKDGSVDLKHAVGVQLFKTLQKSDLIHIVREEINTAAPDNLGQFHLSIDCAQSSLQHSNVRALHIDGKMPTEALVQMCWRPYASQMTLNQNAEFRVYLCIVSIGRG